MSRILITGVEGFIGGHLAIRFLESGNFLIGSWFKGLKTSYLFWYLRKNLELQKKIKFVFLDIRNRRRVLKILRENKIDVLFHLAAISTVEDGLTNPHNTFSTNIGGTVNILEACRSFQNTKAIILAGSDKSYGISAKSGGYRENQEVKGACPYSCSKASVDLIGRTYASIYNMPIVIVRCVNIYGEGDRKKTRIVPRTIASILEGKPVTVHGDGEYIRDFLYVDDLISGYFLILQKILRKEVTSEVVYNFGTGKGFSCLEVIHRLFKISGTEARIIQKSPPKGIIRRQVSDPSRARNDLGWKARVRFEDGLGKTFDWYKNYGKYVV